MEHHFNVNLAIRFGIEKAAIINNLYYWINHNAKNNKNIYDGKVWTFNSTGAFAKLIPYIKERTLYRYLNELEKAKVILIGNFNKNSFDKTKWYSFTDEFVKILEAEGYDVENIIVCQNVNIDMHKMANRDTQSGETIPCNKRILKTNIKDIDKSISQNGSEQGYGDKLPPSDAPLPFSLASDAPSPDAVGSSENTACGVNVNSLKAPLPPTPRMSSDVSVDDADNSNADKSKRKKHKAKFDVYADLSYVDEAYADIWREWLEYKDAINKQYNVQKGAISQYKSLLKYADNNVILANAIVKKSIEHSWNGLFGLSDKEKELYLSERSPYYVKSNEPALPNGMTREKYEMYIRNGYEIDEYGRIYKDGIMLK